MRINPATPGRALPGLAAALDEIIADDVMADRLDVPGRELVELDVLDVAVQLALALELAPVSAEVEAREVSGGAGPRAGRSAGTSVDDLRRHTIGRNSGSEERCQMMRRLGWQASRSNVNRRPVN